MPPHHLKFVLLQLLLFLGYGLGDEISITKSNLKQNYKRGELVFADEFNEFNLETWSHEVTLGGNGNWEFQMYTNSRATTFVKNGHLYLKPTLTSDRYGVDFVYNGQLSLQGGVPVEGCTSPRNYGCFRTGNYPDIINPVMSAKIRTVDSFYFQYGRIDVRAKFPGGDWMAPSISMFPRFNQYGSWPASGEIDIASSRGNRLLRMGEGTNFGSNFVVSNLHYAPNWDAWESGFYKTQVVFEAPDDQGFDTVFHVYSMEWTDEYISFLVDNMTTRVIAPPDGGFWELGFDNNFYYKYQNPWQAGRNPRMAPFDEKFFLTINIAVGGTNGFWPDEVVTGPQRKEKPWKNKSRKSFRDFYEALNDWYPTWEGDNGAMIVDYIRVYAV